MNRRTNHKAFATAAVLLAIAVGAAACGMEQAARPARTAAAKTHAGHTDEVSKEEVKKKAQDKAHKTGEVCAVISDALLPACRCFRAEAEAAGSALPPPMPRRPD